MSWEDVQRKVLDHARGGLVVTGPPGSGKTGLLRERFARLVEAGADPERVVLFVLDRRAARRARDELIHRLERSLPDLPVFTVHGFAFRILGESFDRLGYAEPPQVLSAPEQYAFVRGTLQDEDAGDWPRLGVYLAEPDFARQAADFVLRAQERLLDPGELAEISTRDEDREMAAFYGRYLDAVASAGQVDFAGLLFQTARVLDESDAGFDHVLVDDYQDATHAAEGILRSLAAGARTAVVAADPSGHVFSYRGGSLDPYRRLDETLGGPERVELSASRRLSDEGRSLEALDHPTAVGDGPPQWLSARLYAHPGEEAEAIAHELLRRRVDEDLSWEAMAVVLRRYGGYLTALRHALARHRIPFVVVAEAAEIAAEPANRPIVDLLRFVFREERREELVESVLTSPIGGLDPHETRRLRREARRASASLLDLVLTSPPDAIPSALRDRVLALRDLVERMPSVEEERGPDGLFHWLWTSLPHVRGLVAEEGRQRDLDALAALAGVLSRFVERRPGSRIEDYLDTLEAAGFGPDPWIPPEERHPQAVRIISAHRAQGLEFDVVLIAGCLEGEFPSLGARSALIDLEAIVDPKPPADRLRERLAEERALFRLAVSRARLATVLFASTSSGARRPRRPSRFAERLGIVWEPPREVAPPAVSLRSMEAALRLRLADPEAPREERLAAAAALPATRARPGAWWHGRDWTDPGHPIREGEFQTSFSRLEALEACGLLYLGKTELGLDPDATHYMWLGSLIHEIIERVQKGELPREPDALIEALDAAWEPEQFPHRAVEHRRRIDAEEMLRRWVEHDRRDAVASEAAFSFEIAGAHLRGRIDAIFEMNNGGLHILDYKSGKNAPTQKDIESNLQLATYYLGVKRDPELSGLGEPKYLELAFLGKEHYKEGFTKRGFLATRVEGYEEFAEARLEELIGRVRAEDFKPVANDECRRCALRVICPIQIEGGEVPV
ncbi:MAG TPA: ATP-dependent DNA helicase [Actinomycetota bacterium]|nr:ATP-dependent DNA helicase [Actinomycetota bacterium]